MTGKLLLHMCDYICYPPTPFNKNRSIINVIPNINTVLLHEELTINVGKHNHARVGLNKGWDPRKLLCLSLQGEEPWTLPAWQNKAPQGWNMAGFVLLSTWTTLLWHSTSGSSGHIFSAGQEQWKVRGQLKSRSSALQWASEDRIFSGQGHLKQEKKVWVRDKIVPSHWA